jgi:hypothetical protein
LSNTVERKREDETGADIVLSAPQLSPEAHQAEPALSVHVGCPRLPADAKGDAILLVDVPVVDAVFLFVFVGHVSRGGRRLGPRECRRESQHSQNGRGRKDGAGSVHRANSFNGRAARKR